MDMETSATAPVDCAVLGGSRLSAPYQRACDSVTQSLFELELLVGAGVLAGADRAGVEELLESPLDDDGVVELGADDELSDDAAFDDELEPPRLSVL